MTHEAPAYLSRAQLSGVILRIPCDRARIEQALARVGPVRLAPSGHHADVHPLHCELWNVGGGSLQFGSVDQHALAQRFGAAWGVGVSAIWALALSPWGRLRYDPAVPGRAAEWNALMASRATASVAGTYREAMVSVPGVVVEGQDPSEECTWVAGMVTDSPFARWADRALGYGYGKVLGRIEVDPGERWAVSTAGGSRLLSIERARSVPTHEPPDVRLLDALFAQPLLGSPCPGALARSWLQRSLATRDARVEPVGVTIEASDEFMAGLLPGRLEVLPYDDQGWGGLEFWGVEAAVSFPGTVMR